MWYYKEEKGICVRPLSPNRTELGYFNHCREHPFSISNQTVEDEFYSGEGRFYYYDIKLGSHVDIDEYKKFITEFLRRGETDDCLVHISNVMWDRSRDKDLVSIYDLPQLLELIETTIAIPQYVYVDLDDKRFTPITKRELNEVNNLYRLLSDKPNVIGFALNETQYTRRPFEVSSERIIAEFNCHYKKLLTNEE